MNEEEIRKQEAEGFCKDAESSNSGDNRGVAVSSGENVRMYFLGVEETYCCETTCSNSVLSVYARRCFSVSEAFS